MPARLVKGFPEQMVFELAIYRMNCNLLYGEGQGKDISGYRKKHLQKLDSKLDIFHLQSQVYNGVSGILSL